MPDLAPTVAVDFATHTGSERYKVLIGAVVAKVDRNEASEPGPTAAGPGRRRSAARCRDANSQ